MKYRVRTDWRGKLILQIASRPFGEWRDATVEDISEYPKENSCLTPVLECK